MQLNISAKGQTSSFMLTAFRGISLNAQLLRVGTKAILSGKNYAVS